MSRRDVSRIGSPVIKVTIGDIIAGASEQHNLDLGEYLKYSHYDFMEILNDSGLNLELILNDVHRFAIPAQSSVVKSDISFRRFKIINNTAVNLTGTDIYLSVQHRPMDADILARKPKGLFDYIPLAGFFMR